MSKSRKYGLSIGDYLPRQSAFVVYSRKNTVTLLSGVTWKIKTLPRKTLSNDRLFIYDETFKFFLDDTEYNLYIASFNEKELEIKKQLDGFLRSRGLQGVHPKSTWFTGALCLTPVPKSKADAIELGFRRARKYDGFTLKRNRKAY